MSNDCYLASTFKSETSHMSKFMHTDGNYLNQLDITDSYKIIKIVNRIVLGKISWTLHLKLPISMGVVTGQEEKTSSFTHSVRIQFKWKK